VGLGLYVLGIFLCCFFVPNVPSPGVFPNLFNVSRLGLQRELETAHATGLLQQAPAVFAHHTAQRFLSGGVYGELTPGGLAFTEALDRYDGFMDKANAVPGFMEAEREYNLALMNMEEVEVWFWYWREPYKWEVPPLKAVVKQKERVLAKLVDQRKGLVLDAKRSVGPFSTFAVVRTLPRPPLLLLCCAVRVLTTQRVRVSRRQAEARSMFWDRVERGKVRVASLSPHATFLTVAPPPCTVRRWV
jgi:hypothetical protein